MRKAFAGALIRLAHRIYPPKVTVDNNVHLNMSMSLADLERWREQQEKLLSSVHFYGTDGSVWDIGAGGGGGGGTYLPPDDGPAPVSC